MRRFKATSITEACRIEKIEDGTIYPHPDDHDEPFRPAQGDEWIKKYNPGPGGYFVRYPDGYESFCPAEAWEAGHVETDEPVGFGQGDCCEGDSKVSTGELIGDDGCGADGETTASESRPYLSDSIELSDVGLSDELLDRLDKAGFKTVGEVRDADEGREPGKLLTDLPGITDDDVEEVTGKLLNSAVPKQ